MRRITGTERYEEDRDCITSGIWDNLNRVRKYKNIWNHGILVNNFIPGSEFSIPGRPDRHAVECITWYEINFCVSWTSYEIHLSQIFCELKENWWNGILYLRNFHKIWSVKYKERFFSGETRAQKIQLFKEVYNEDVQISQ